MRTLSRYLAKEVTVSSLLLLGALLVLFALLDLVRELGIVGYANYRMGAALIFVALNVPGHVYELLPLALLIGTIFTFTQLALHSEYTVMRASGASFGRIGRSILGTGLLFAVATFVFGEFVAPLSERVAQQMRFKALAGFVVQQFRSGLWVKDGSSFINVRQVLTDNTLVDVRIMQFDENYRLRSLKFARQGVYQGPNLWRLNDVRETRLDEGRATTHHEAFTDWQSELNPDILSVLLVDPQKMSALNLWSYVKHLRDNRQKAIRYEIALWGKFIYPLAAVVMMILALPFAALQRRSGGVGVKMLAGIMLGLAFHLVSRLFAHAGQLNDWPPLFAAAAPSLLFLGIAVGMIWWVERR